MNLRDDFNRVSYFTDLFRSLRENNIFARLRQTRYFPPSPWDRINPA